MPRINQGWLIISWRVLIHRCYIQAVSVSALCESRVTEVGLLPQRDGSPEETWVHVLAETTRHGSSLVQHHITSKVINKPAADQRCVRQLEALPSNECK